MLPEPNCFRRRCVHYIGVFQKEGDEKTERHICRAFPNGIPTEIAFGENLHAAPYPGDNGIQYEPVEE
jgi:hypothetical protein